MRKQNLFSWVTEENMEVSSGESDELGENLAVVKYSVFEYPSLLELPTPFIK